MKSFLVFLIFVGFIFFAQEVSAQFIPPPPVPVSPPPNAIPIDGGLSWLLAAGGVYGVSKLRKNFKK